MKIKTTFPSLLFVLILSACNLGAPAAPAAPTQTPVQALFAKLPPPPDGKPQAAGTYVGALGDSNILIGLVVQDGIAGVYLCDGQDISEWFGGKAATDQLDLTSPKQTHLTATLGATITGQVTLADGRTLDFTAQPAVEGKTGLFRLAEKLSDDEIKVTGWIATETAQVGRVIRVNIKDGTSNVIDGTSNTAK